MKSIQIIGVSLALLMLVTACENHLSKSDDGTMPDGNVIIKIAGARTVLPSASVFSKYELTLQQEGGEPITVGDTSGIDGAGKGLYLNEGTWTITLSAYQDVLKNGRPVLAARGSAQIEVQTGDRAKTVFITLNPLAIGESTDPGVFSYVITLPEGAASATLSLKNSGGGSVEGYPAALTSETLSGRIVLPAGYYDLSIIVTKNGQSAGAFESVHIYSGLESPLTLDLSTVAFANKVYIAGTLGGVRLGTVKITGDAGGINAIGTPLQLSGAGAVRSANWVIDIPSSYVGQTVYAVQEFNNEKSTVVSIANVPVGGKTDVALSLAPTTPSLMNVTAWYSELTASGGEASLAKVADNSTSVYWQSERAGNGSVWMELDFGFPVTVNAARLIFYTASPSGSVLVSEYNVQYRNAANAWVSVVNRKHSLRGSPDAYSNFFTEITAQKFRWEVPALSVEDAPALIEFGLYKAVTDRAGLPAVIAAAQHNYNTTNADTSPGSNTEIGRYWVTAAKKQTYQNAINAAQAAYDDPTKSSAQLTAAKNALDAATTAFNGLKQEGVSGDVLVNGFSVQDGYADRFVVKWEKEPFKEYTISMSSDPDSGYELIENFPKEIDSEDEMFSYLVPGIPADTIRYFRMQASRTINGSEVDGTEISSGAKRTMGVPVLTLVTNASYRTVSLSWTEAQKADAYRVVYSIDGDAQSPHAKEVAINELTPVTGGYTYSFVPNGYDNPQITGKEIDIKIEALNEALYEASGCDREDITTTSDSVETRLVGPAALSTSATKATLPASIELSWETVPGANGYYVYRRQFNMTDTVEAASAIAYYVPDGSGALTVTGKGIGPGDTTVTKAAAVAANGHFTLTDSQMSDAEYSGAYNGYAANYKNQQNDIARGNPYRYFVVPVINEADTIALQYASNGSVSSYSITSSVNSDVVEYTGSGSIEKTGFAVGFGQNVTATKGTYASSGNVNNGIQITWSAPPLLAGAGVTPQYTLWRKAYNETTWSYDPAPVTGTSYNDTLVANPSTQRGIVYEYAVGINNSRPVDSSRFMSDSKGTADAKGRYAREGYILDMVKLSSVSRNEIKVGTQFGEDVTFYNTGVKNSGTDTNWGIDGYTVYVMNRNINGDWHVIKDNVAATSGANTTQVVQVTTGQVSFNGRDLLRVMRDYKHYFKVRSYVLNSSGAKVYCADPDWNFETLFAANRTSQDNANFIQNDYVKWGARQITPTEFAQITTLHIAWGIHGNRGTTSNGWQTRWKNAYWLSTNGNNGSSGRMGAESSWGVGQWWFYFDRYKPDLDTFANKSNWTYSTTFLTLNADNGSTTSGRMVFGDSYGAGCFPRWYGRDGSYGASYLSITGPSCVSPLYSGELRFGDGSGNGHLTWNQNQEKSGYMQVKYPASAAAVNVSDGQTNTPLPFEGQSNAWYSDTTSVRFYADAWY